MNRIDQIKKSILNPPIPCLDGWEANRGIQGAITGALNTAMHVDPTVTMEGCSAYRRMLLAYLFWDGKTAISSHQLTREQWWCLYQWIGFWNDPIEGWQKRSEFRTEAGLLLGHILRSEREKLEQFMTPP